LYSAPSSLAHSADLKVRQFSGRELVILHWRSIAVALIDCIRSARTSLPPVSQLEFHIVEKLG